MGKKKIFKDFVLSNRFPNYVFLDNKKSAYVCVDIVADGLELLNVIARKLVSLENAHPDNTHLSQRRPLDVVLGRLQRPKDSPYFVVLVFGTGFGCGNVRLVIIPLLCLAQPMGRL